MAKMLLETRALRDALAVLTKVVPRTSNIPTIQNVRLEMNGDVTLAATDLEIGAMIRLPRLGGDGTAVAVVPAHRLAQAIRAKKAERVTLEIGADNVLRVDDSGRLVGEDPADYPTLPKLTGKPVAVFKAADFAQAVKSVVFACSTEVVRYVLTGVLVETAKKNAHLVTSDGKRLASQGLTPVRAPRECRAIFSVKLLQLAAGLAVKAGADGTVGVYLHDDELTAHLTIGDAVVYGQLMEGTFPDWQAVTPAIEDAPWTMDRAALTAALVTVLQGCSEKNMAVRFTFGDGKLTLFSRAQDVGEASAELPVEGDRELAVVFNPDFVLDYLKALPKGVERVTVNAKDKTSASVWTASDRHVYVLMPLVVQV